MKSFKDMLFGKKSVIAVNAISEITRDGINKAYIPKFLYKPPFGYPRFANMPYVRWLAQTPYVEMCIDTILSEIASIKWDIVPAEGMEDQADATEIQHIKNFFLNPNTNDESFEDVFIKMPLRDVLEVNSGILNKVYNMKEELVEVVARDGATFTKNPDIHGMFTDRKDILLPKHIVKNTSEVINPFQQISQYVASEEAAYFQYGWIAGPVPVPFGKKEIMWLQKMRRTDDHYGYSPIQVLAKALQRLLWDIDSDLEYYNDNNVPKGVLGIDDTDADDIDAFKEQWYDLQRKKDEFGNWKKLVHKVPIVNRTPTFTRIEFSSEEMQLIEKQKWYSKMVWACFGVTSTELGYTEDAKGSANQIVQSKVFRKKAINPLLRMMEYNYNKNIVSEFGYFGTLKTDKGKMIEVPKYEFKFLVFDTDEERNKAELYKLWVENGIKTVNEIRQEEGLEEVEWGDQAPGQWRNAAPNNTNFYGNYDDRQNNAQNTDQRTKQPDVNQKSQQNIESKDFFEILNKGTDPEMLRSSIVAELGAISLYEDMAKNTKDAKLKKMFLDIAKEEKVHVGEFEYLLNEYKDTEQGDAIKDGKKEVIDKLEGKSLIEDDEKDMKSSKEDRIKEAMRHPDKTGAGAKKRKKLSPDEKFEAVMREFARGTLHSGSGAKVTSRKQALSIAYSESGKKSEDKAQDLDSPLILHEFERPTGSERLEKAMNYVLKQQEDEIIDILEQEMKQSQISEIKDLNQLVSKLKSIVTFEGLRQITANIIRNNYMKGWDQAEKEMNRNFVPEMHAIEYLQKYTFENIQGMKEDIVNKLRQELQRAYMAGEGIDKIKTRVKEVFKVGDNRSEMIARTETNRASNVGKLQAYQKSGETGKKMWISKIDDRTSPLCKRLDGQVVGLNENFKDPEGEWEGPSPPSHVNCRSTWSFRPESEN